MNQKADLMNKKKYKRINILDWSILFVVILLIFVVYKMIIFHPYQNLYFSFPFKKARYQNDKQNKITKVLKLLTVF